MTCSACGAALPEDARFCPACGVAVERAAVVGEERKLATVLFADLVGSTASAHAEDPERVRARLERFYDAMAEEIERTGGTVESFAGDSVMAAFGAPAALEDHAERALHAALAMQRRLRELFGDELQLRIGVNTGEVVVGRPREGGSFVTGDAVNVGARLEQSAEAGEVLVGGRTVAAARGAFEFGDPRVVEAKGKPGGVACRPVLREHALMRPRGVRGLKRVFVGRESELDLLRATFRRAVAQGEPHSVTIVGEPGVGKTRVVRELDELLAEEEPAPLRRTGRCLAYGDGITYWPVGEFLKQELGILDSDRPEEVRKRLSGREILGLALGLDAGRDLHPLDARERLHDAVVALVEEIAGKRPLVVLIEDIHWAEDDLLDLLERVVREARVPLLLLATARPELTSRRLTWSAGRRNATTIWLEPLPPSATAQMLDGLLSTELPAAIEGLLVETAEGNPFFLEELVGELVESGVLVREEGSWTTRALPEGFSVPDSVHAVLAARIDRLPAGEKATLQAASVVGRLFWAGSVEALLDGTEPRLELLEERDFIRSRGSSTMAGEREYAIKHALTREVAYASIPKARRGRLHAAFADWLEEKDPGKDEYAPLLAYHYAEAVRPEDSDLVWAELPDEARRIRALAVVSLRRAAELACGRYEMDEAVELFSRAIELADDDRERSLLWRDLGLAHALRYDGNGFWGAMQRALDGALTREEEADVYSLLAFQTSIRSAMWSVRPDPDVTRSWADAALSRAEHVPAVRIRSLLTYANLERVGSLADALEASELAEELGDPELRSYALSARGYEAFAAYRFDDAEALNARRFELMPEITDPDHLTEAYESAIPTIATVGRLDEARRLASKHQVLSSRLSPHHRLHGIALQYEIEEAAGRWEQLVAGVGVVREAVEANLATPCIRNARSLLLCAVAHLALGHEDAARDLEAQGNLIEGTGFEPTLAPPRIRLALLRGDAAEVRHLLELDVLRHARVFGPGTHVALLDGLAALRDAARIEELAPPLARQGLLLEPFALRALGIGRGDDSLIGQAQERFRALGLEWHAAQTDALVSGIA